MSPELEYAEEWLPVVGYEGLYTVSNLGRVRSEPRIDSQGRQHGGYLLRQTLKFQCYLQVKLSKNGKARTRDVHTLVAAAFLGTRPKGMLVHHLDGNKLHNAIGNLTYMARKEHIPHHFAQKPWKGSPAKLTDAQVIEIRHLRTEGMTQRAIAQLFGVSREHVRDIVNGKYRKIKN